MIIIGEKINGSIPAVAQAIAARDAEFIKERARAQAAAGATCIDCCASVEEVVEVETLKWMIGCIQEATDLPISVDSPSPDVLCEVVKQGICNKPGLINSVSMEGDKVEKIFPLIADTDWEVICLLSDDTGIPKCAADRLKVFDKLMAKAKEYGIAPKRMHIDPLIEMLCTSEDGIAMNEEVISTVRKQYPDIHITAAVSNISFNLPARKMVNQGFTVLAMYSGLDSAIFDPLNKDLMGLISATDKLLASGISEEPELDAIKAQMSDAQKKYVLPAYAVLAMKAELIEPEEDEEYEERDIEGLTDELMERADEEISRRDLLGLMYATDALLGNDDYCMAYIGAFRSGDFGPVKKIKNTSLRRDGIHEYIKKCGGNRNVRNSESSPIGRKR